MYNCKKGQTKSEDCYDMRLQANLPDERENLTCRHYITIQLTQLASFFIAGSMQRLFMAGGLTIYSSVGNISFPWVFYVFWSVITIINIISSHFSHLKDPLSCPPFFPRVRRFSLHTRRVFQ